MSESDVAMRLTMRSSKSESTFDGLEPAALAVPDVSGSMELTGRFVPFLERFEDI